MLDLLHDKGPSPSICVSGHDIVVARDPAIPIMDSTPNFVGLLMHYHPFLSK